MQESTLLPEGIRANHLATAGSAVVKMMNATYGLKCLELLKPGGVILIDNTLWAGLVLKPGNTATTAIDTVNKMIKNDQRVEHVLLTVRDGVHLVRKK